MQKWEYSATPSVGSNMKKMGDEGWDLVSIENAIMWWKRPVEDGEPAEPAETVHDRIHQTLVDIRGHLMSQAPKSDAADTGSSKPLPSNPTQIQPPERPIDKTEPALRSPSTGLTDSLTQDGHKPANP